ncbi:hypothetical protein AMTRI_Chr10g225450 [Amborella trichopoda]
MALLSPSKFALSFTLIFLLQCCMCSTKSSAPLMDSSGFPSSSVENPHPLNVKTTQEALLSTMNPMNVPVPPSGPSMRHN